MMLPLSCVSTKPAWITGATAAAETVAFVIGNRSPTVAIFINIIYSPVLKTLARWA